MPRTFVQMFGSGGDFAPPAVFNPDSLPNHLLRYKFNTGINGSPVDQWDDQWANAFHLTITGSKRPSVSGGVITFDGSDDELNVAFGSTKAQPLTFYMLVRQISYTFNRNIFGTIGADSNDVGCRQHASSPEIKINANTDACVNTDLPVDANFYAVACVFNGASSLIQVRGFSPTTGNPGTNGMIGLTLGALRAATFGNVAFKEFIGYEAAHDATNRDLVLDYLAAL